MSEVPEEVLGVEKFGEDEEEEEEGLPPHTFAKRYELVERLGTGSFGDIWLARDQHHAGVHVALKLEPEGADLPQLEFEIRAYQYLRAADGSSPLGVPSLYNFGTQAPLAPRDGHFRFMAIEALGHSLEGLRAKTARGRFSLKTVLMLSDQLLMRLEYLHDHAHLLHRDIKPDNFLMGRPGTRHAPIVFMVDYGLSKPYLRTSDGRLMGGAAAGAGGGAAAVHMPARTDKQMAGTLRYASIRNHEGCEQSRRDDLESLAYVLIYLFTGRLPWQGLKKPKGTSINRATAAKKRDTPLDEVVGDLPEEYAQLVRYARGMGFSDRPDYAGWRRKLRGVATARGIEYDMVYDWTAPP